MRRNGTNEYKPTIEVLSSRTLDFEQLYSLKVDIVVMEVLLDCSQIQSIKYSGNRLLEKDKQ